ncbi:TPA: hypothetical protein O9Q41_002397 [Staphylococcus aureus]|nr:hypothetical protein [Staphylococcus aureus]
MPFDSLAVLITTEIAFPTEIFEKY